MWDFISKGVGLLSSGPGKLIIIASMLTAIISFSMWGYNSIFSAGYNEAALKYEQSMSVILQDEVAKAQVEWQSHVDENLALIEREKIIVEKVKTVYRDVYKTEYVCEDIGQNAVDLLNRVFIMEVVQ